MALNTKKLIYIRLLNEGTDVSRPTEALELGSGLFRVLPTHDYDPEDEEWEFLPGSVVECEKIQDAQGEHLCAVKLGGEEEKGTQ